MVTKSLITIKRKEKEKSKCKELKRKEKIQIGLVFSFYSLTCSFSTDWIVDSGCTNHLCFEKDKFENFHKYKKDAVVIGDNSILEVQGIGSVLIHGKVLENVLYVPKLRINFLFMIQVTRKGYSFEFDSHS